MMKWNKVEEYEIQSVGGQTIMTSSDAESSKFYFKQTLFSNLSYTTIVKFDHEFNLSWEKVYKADSRHTEPMILDDQENLYAVFKNGQDQTSQDLIVQLNEKDGKCKFTKKITNEGDIQISMLYYHQNDKISFLLHQKPQNARI